MNFPWPSLGGFAQTSTLPSAAAYPVAPHHFSFNPPMGITVPHTFDAQIIRPVGELPNDEEVLISALCAGRQKGLSVHDSFNELHTVMSFASSPLTDLCLCKRITANPFASGERSHCISMERILPETPSCPQPTHRRHHCSSKPLRRTIWIIGLAILLSNGCCYPFGGGIRIRIRHGMDPSTCGNIQETTPHRARL